MCFQITAGMAVPAQGFHYNNQFQFNAGYNNQLRENTQSPEYNKISVKSGTLKIIELSHP